MGGREAAAPRAAIVYDYAMVVIGALVVAAGANPFLVPNRVVAGGVTGVAIILHVVIGTPVGLVVLALNVPLLWLGYRHAGGMRLFLRTLVAVVVMAVAIDVTAPLLEPPTGSW